MSETPSEHPDPSAQRPLRQLPRDELMTYAEDLGLGLSHDLDAEALAQAVESRLHLIEALPREVLLEIVMWARRPVKQSAGKLELVRQIVPIRRVRFAGLGTDALRAMALLHNCPVEPDDDRRTLARKLKRNEGFFQRIRRKRRALVAKVITRLVGDDAADYKFLPEEHRPLSLKERIENEGIVGGLTGKLRGAADDYVRQKLDEIEARIDRKLDEVDRRLGEWRDREIANRMRIIRITLMASVIVALLSLAYTYLKGTVLTWLP